MKLNSFVLFFFFSLSAISQIQYDKGYFISTNGEKVNCLIKNVDWDSNPSEFQYKTSENSSEQLHNVSTVKEFGINNQSRYVSVLVNIDRSSDENRKLTSFRRAILKEEKLFLKELFIGEQNLFLYKEGNLYRYFLNKKNEPSNYVQLIYKRYVPTGITIMVNKRYQQQLATMLKCSSVLPKDIENVKYEKNSLIQILKKYNYCVNPNNGFEDIEKDKKKLQVHVYLRPGIKSSSLLYQELRQNSVSQFDFGNKLNFRFGIETEFILPFNKNKWSIFLEPTFQSFKSNDEASDNNVNYKSIEVPIGARHYLFLKNSKLYINGGTVLDNPINSSLNGRESTFSFNLMYGIGFMFQERFGIEIRRQTRRDIISQFTNLFGDFVGEYSIILNYKIF